MRVEKKDSPILLGQNGPLRGMNWTINHSIKIGRDPSCGIVINNRQVSRFHAEIQSKNEKEVMLIDLESKNGTFLNGDPISREVLLKDGDEIKIALIQEFIFVNSDATLPIDQIIETSAFSNKKLFIDVKARRIWLGENEIKPTLSVSQYSLLYLLYQNEGKVISREEIVNTVWGEAVSIGVTEQAIDALVRRLRSRLNKYDQNHEYIQTVRGVGYIFENGNY